ncbi:TetR/AcrR family transcriptional regulator [Aureimonas altamirensis]|uniref:TetR/AcrR family transcriptional regulator n=1 Tax=Aureimonas altamirensis TaxID=370622 RepID=UPI00301B61AB
MAGRPRTIDRDKVLDAAEAVVQRTGASGLTIEAVAREAGITKGGVQYCFGSKDSLINAMLQRWCEGFDAAVHRLAGPQADAIATLRGHVEANRKTDAAEHSRSSAMMAALLQPPSQIAETRAWYTSRLAGLDVTSEEARRVRLAFLASEGVFYLRAFDLVALDDAEWSDILDDISALSDGR